MAEQPVDPDRQALLERLTDAGIRFVVVGGAAIQTYGITYRTEDVDLTPDVSEDNLQRLSDVLNELGCSLEIDPARPETAVKLPPGYVTPKFLRDAHALNAGAVPRQEGLRPARRRVAGMGRRARRA